MTNSQQPNQGSIPTCVGEPAGCDLAGAVAGVYPHVCGGTNEQYYQPQRAQGLSPRVWGNPGAIEDVSVRSRSIPTCVGEPGGREIVHLDEWVYPHVCGGTNDNSFNMRHETGLSPRVWGNRERVDHQVDLAGSIPTCVGEPGMSASPSRHTRVYPHVCGGTIRPRLVPYTALDLSPRVWGNRNQDRRYDRKERSIPTCVGEPVVENHEEREEAVYPHVCGGTSVDDRYAHPVQGLSPRVWGNHPDVGPYTDRLRSIPTCVGEPS